MNSKSLLFLQSCLFLSSLPSYASVSCDNPKDISLDQMIEMNFIDEIMNIEVTSSTKTPEKIKNAPSIINTFTANDIRDLGARTISDVLQIIPGFQIQTKHTNRQKSWTRGIQSEFGQKTALYIDNVPYVGSFGGFPIDEEIPIEIIKRIEVIRGPGSALYGANAFSGVINIITHTPCERKQNTVKLGIGEKDTELAYFSLQGQLSTFKVMLEGKFFDTAGRKPLYDREGHENIKSGNQDLAFLHLKVSAFDDELVFSAMASQFNNERIDKNTLDDNHRRFDNLRLNLSYQHKFDDQWKVNFNTYFTQIDRIEHEIDLREGFLKREITHSKGGSEIAGVYATVGYKPIDSNEVVMGIDFKRSKYNRTPNPKKVQDYIKIALSDYGYFIQDTQSLFDNKTKLTIGLRFDSMQLFENQFSYRAGITHSFTDEFFVKLLYGTAFRSPSYSEFRNIAIKSDLPKAETLETIEAQIGYQQKTTANENQAARYTLTLFRNNYKDIIRRRRSDDIEIHGAFGNDDNLIVYGVEFESRVFFSKNWNGFLNASWSNAHSEENEGLLPLMANWTVAAGIEWRKQIWRGELAFHNHIIAYGDRKDWSDELPRVDNRDDSLADGFVTWNMGLHYRIKTIKEQQLDLSLTAHNLLDEVYFSQSSTQPSFDKTANFDNQYKGRQIRFSIGYHW